MNETFDTTPVAEANAPAATPLTDAEINKLLALPADGAYVAEEDEVLADTANTIH